MRWPVQVEESGHSLGRTARTQRGEGVSNPSAGCVRESRVRSQASGESAAGKEWRRDDSLVEALRGVAVSCSDGLVLGDQSRCR